jgi:hypothetical protein
MESLGKPTVRCADVDCLSDFFNRSDFAAGIQHAAAAAGSNPPL